MGPAISPGTAGNTGSFYKLTHFEAAVVNGQVLGLGDSSGPSSENTFLPIPGIFNGTGGTYDVGSATVSFLGGRSCLELRSLNKQ